MSVEQRQEICALVDTFSGGWTKDNLKKMLQLDYVKANDIKKLHGCHLTAKGDPSVFINPVIPGNDLRVGVVAPAKR